MIAFSSREIYLRILNYLVSPSFLGMLRWRARCITPCRYLGEVKATRKGFRMIVTCLRCGRGVWYKEEGLSLPLSRLHGHEAVMPNGSTPLPAAIRNGDPDMVEVMFASMKPFLPNYS